MRASTRSGSTRTAANRLASGSHGPSRRRLLSRKNNVSAGWPEDSWKTRSGVRASGEWDECPNERTLSSREVWVKNSSDRMPWAAPHMSPRGCRGVSRSPATPSDEVVAPVRTTMR